MTCSAFVNQNAIVQILVPLNLGFLDWKLLVEIKIGLRGNVILQMKN
jgi:hypothetical protein